MKLSIYSSPKKKKKRTEGRIHFPEEEEEEDPPLTSSLYTVRNFVGRRNLHHVEFRADSRSDNDLQLSRGVRGSCLLYSSRARASKMMKVTVVMQPR